MIDKVKYELAKASGTLELVRGDEISRLIRTKYPLSAQIAILMDRDAKPVEYEAYQAFRAECKAKVDAEIEDMERYLNEVVE
jgi:hypothetical protein